MQRFFCKLGEAIGILAVIFSPAAALGSEHNGSSPEGKPAIILASVGTTVPAAPPSA